MCVSGCLSSSLHCVLRHTKPDVNLVKFESVQFLKKLKSCDTELCTVYVRTCMCMYVHAMSMICSNHCVKSERRLLLRLERAN